MSATCVGVTPSLPLSNPNASQTDERLVQLTRTDGHDDNPGLQIHLCHHPRTLNATSPMTAPCNSAEQSLVLHPHTPFQGGWDF